MKAMLDDIFRKAGVVREVTAAQLEGEESTMSAGGLPPPRNLGRSP